MAQVVVGLDVGSHAVKVARLRLGFRNAELERVATIPLEEPWAAVAELTEGADLVFTALPGDQISVRRFRVAAGAAKRLEPILAQQLDGEIPFDIKETVFDHLVLSHDSESLDIVVGAARHTDVERHLAMLADHGIDPREVGAGALALADMGHVIAPTGTVAIVDIGHGHTDLCILQEGKPVTARTLSVGGGDVTASLARAFDVTEAVAAEWKASARYLADIDPALLDAEQRMAVDAVRRAVELLVRELRQSLAAFELASGGKVDSLVLAGGGARLEGLREHLAAELQVPTELVKLGPTIGGAGNHDIVLGGRAIALALRGASLRRNRIDLRRGRFAFEGESRGARGVFLYVLAAAVVVMAAWGFSAFGRKVALEREREAQEQELAQISERLVGEKITSFSRLRTLLAQTSGPGADEAPIPPADAFDIVEEISKRIPSDINHEIDSLDIRAGRVQIQGFVDEVREAEAIAAALSEWEKCFTNVEVTRTSQGVRDNKRRQYTMDIESRCP